MDRSWFSKLAAAARDTGRVLAIAWRMDAQLTFLYYLTAVGAALAPLASGWTLSLLVDRRVGRVVAAPVIVAVVVATHLAIVVINNAVRRGLHERYHDDVFRYRLQDMFTQWRVPDLFRVLACAVIAAVGALSAAIVLARFGGWIVPLVIAASAPRIALRTRLGELQRSMYGPGTPACRRRRYLGELISDASELREHDVLRAAPALLSRYRATRARTLALDRWSRWLRVIAPLAEAAVVVAIAWSRLRDVTTGALSVGSFALFVAMLQQLATSSADLVSAARATHEDLLCVRRWNELMARATRR